jgi:hypothetical protein
MAARRVNARERLRLIARLVNAATAQRRRAKSTKESRGCRLKSAASTNRDSL